MRKWQRVWATTAGLLVLLSMLAACGPSAGGSTASQVKKGGSVVDIFDEEPDTFVPWFTSETFGFMAMQQVWAGLWNTDQNLNIVANGIAKEVPSVDNGDVSADLKTFTIKLKPGLKWSDGSPETIDDCIATWNALSDPAGGNLGGFPTTDAKKDPFIFVSATKVDDLTGKLQFQNPFGSFLATFANGGATCYPKSVLGSQKVADFAKAQQFQPTLTNGPFKIKERVGGSHITMVKNPNYFLGPDKPYLDQITDNIVTDSNTILANFQAGSADTGWFLDTTKLNDFKAIAGYSTFFDNGAGYEWLIYNLHDPILADKNVRKALQESIDPPNEIYQTIYKGSAKQTCDDHAGTFAHEPSLIPCYKFDVAQANADLDAGGWTGRTPAGCTLGQGDCYRTKDGKTLELEYATTAKKAREDTQAIFIQDWKKIGMLVHQKNYSNTQDWFGTGALCQGKFQIGEFANSITDPDDHTSFATDQTCANGGGNYGFYSNSTVDEQEKAQLSTLDINKRKAAFHIIHAEILKDIPATYLFAAGNLSLHNNRVQNYLPAPAGAAETWNVDSWWVNK